jgi:sugar transferase (PEP-CTERM system associated)
MLWLLALEAVVFAFAMRAGATLRFLHGSVDMETSIGPLLPKAVVFAVVMVLSMTATGLYQRKLRDGPSGLLLRVFASFALGMVALSVIFYAFPALFLGRGALLLAFGIAFAAVAIIRMVYLALADQEAGKRRVLVLGTGRKASLIGQFRRRSDQRGFIVIGHVPLPGEHSIIDPSRIIVPGVSLLDHVRRHDIDEIVIAPDDYRKGLPVQGLLECRMSGVAVTDLLSFFEREAGKVKLEILQPSWMIFSEGFRTGGFQAIGKRAFDVLASLLVLLVTWPVMVLVAAAVWVEGGGRGPLLYRQMRVGQNGRAFELLKFRSMRVDAEADGVPRWAEKDDARITRVGAIIRPTRLDELPQLFNVLKGDMSFVGPRPERPEFVELLVGKIPYYEERHRVKPGITGWAQISYPYGASERDALEKLQYDLYYLKNYSLFLDVIILLQTAEVILWGKGAR